MTKNKTTLFTATISPINDLEKGKLKGDYDWVYDHITKDTVPLKKATGEKKLYFVPVTERVLEGKESQYLAAYGLKPVENAPNYLLGAMATLKEKDLPEELKFKDIVAVGNVVFQFADGRRCFLDCRRRSGERFLFMVRLASGWGAGGGWFFLAEELTPSEVQTLSLSGSLSLEQRVARLENLFSKEVLK